MPNLLDTFGGESGAGTGYERAGWNVYAIEIDPARIKRNPHPCWQGDVLAGMAILLEGHALPFTYPDGTVEHMGLSDFDALHGSPPCTGYSRGTIAIADRLTRYDRLIAVTRELFDATGLPYIIENVEDAKPELRHPITLCGSEFGLQATDSNGTLLAVRRHRLFESNRHLLGAGGCLGHGPRQRRRIAGAYGGTRRDSADAQRAGRGYVPQSVDVLRDLLGVPWMSEKGVFLCIPPVYTEYLGGQLLEAL